MREPLHDERPRHVAPRRAKQRARKSRLVEALVTLLVAVMVAGAFIIGTRVQPKPITPTAQQVVKTECVINTGPVRDAVEQNRATVNLYRKRKITADELDRRIAEGIQRVAEAVRQQQVSCKQVP